jgi:hypothetical protein
MDTPFEYLPTLYVLATSPDAEMAPHAILGRVSDVSQNLNNQRSYRCALKWIYSETRLQG